MNKSNSKKRAAPSPKSAASNANAPNPTACRCTGQLHFHGFPQPPAPSDGPLVEWLESHPGWWGRQFLCTTLGIDERTLRLQAEHSGGWVIFNSGMGGLAATIHAEKIEIRNCAAELRARAASHLRRAIEIEQALQEMGVRT